MDERMFDDLNKAIDGFEASLYKEGFRVTAMVDIPDTDGLVLTWGKFDRKWRLTCARDIDGVLENENPLINWSVEARIKASNCIDALRKALVAETEEQKNNIKNATKRWSDAS